MATIKLDWTKVLAPIQSYVPERRFHQFLHRMGFTGGDHVVVGGLLLEH